MSLESTNKKKRIIHKDPFYQGGKVLFIHSDRVKAFTLIEFLVSLGIFVVVISIAINAFIVSLRSQHAASALIAVNDNLSLVLEQMAREMRTGKGFCSRSIINGTPVVSPVPNVSGFDFNFCTTPPLSDNEIAFYNGQDIEIHYRLNDTDRIIERREGAGLFRAITATNVAVERFGIIAQHTDSDGVPPRITLVIRATSNEPGIEQLEIFDDVQTTISPRCGWVGIAPSIPQCPGDM